MPSCNVYRVTGRVLLMLAVCGLLVAGCRKINDTPPAQTLPLAGIYVGYGTLAGGPANILMQIAGPDSLSRYSGAIRYRNAITTLDLVTLCTTAIP